MSVVETFLRDYGPFKVEVHNWELPDQGVTVLWGPSGAGKSTFLRGLIGIDPKAQVKWHWQGQDLAKLLVSERRLGVVFQDLYLFPHMTAQENILFPLSRKQRRQLQAQDDFQFLVAQMDLKACLGRGVQELSGGERQRVALARALIFRPRLLILDEPFVSLDPGLRQGLRQLVRSASESFACPVLMVSHDEADAQQADHLAHMESGKLRSATQVKPGKDVDFPES